MRRAERKTGLTEWGARDFIPRIVAWLEAIHGDVGLNDAGKRQAEAFTLQHACNRLRLEDLIARHPEIESIELAAPIVVSGLPRSGTTALARLLTLLPEKRWLPYWEAIEPFSGDESMKRTNARRRREALIELSPKLARLHDFTQAAFVDDTELQCLAFSSYALEWHAYVPGWRDIYLSVSQESTYRYLKRAMQALTFRKGPSAWLIKSPQHIEQLPALKAVFPDARLVISKRPKHEAINSMDAVMCAMGAVFRRRDFPSTYWRNRFEVMLARYDETKHLFPDRIETDVQEWSAAPAALLERLQ